MVSNSLLDMRLSTQYHHTSMNKFNTNTTVASSTSKTQNETYKDAVAKMIKERAIQASRTKQNLVKELESITKGKSINIDLDESNFSF